MCGCGAGGLAVWLLLLAKAVNDDVNGGTDYDDDDSGGDGFKFGIWNTTACSKFVHTFDVECMTKCFWHKLINFYSV